MNHIIHTVSPTSAELGAAPVDILGRLQQTDDDETWLGYESFHPLTWVPGLRAPSGA